MQSRFETFLFDKRFRWIGHVLFWSFIYVDELMAVLGITPPIENHLQILLFLIMDFAMVYLNLYIFIPRFLQKRKYVLYVFFSGLLILLNIFSSYIYYQSQDWFYDVNQVQLMLETVILNVSIVALAVAFKLFKINYQEINQKKELQELQLKTEMAFLKYQLNPHFLFNALNSLYVLSQKNSNQLDDAILDLSDLLRYQTYDSQKSTIQLNKELEFIDNYYNFEKLRRKNVEWKSQSEGSTEQILIPPMLLFPLAENALKYSTSTDEKTGIIDQSILITEDNLVYSIRNNVLVNKVNDKAYSGLGLTNLRRRLDLLFPNNHTLEIKDDNGYFKVVLTIPLKELKNIQ